MSSKKILLIIFVVLLTGVQVTSAQTYTLNGYVRSVVSNSPVSGLNVCARTFDPTTDYVDDTDENGFYSISGIPGGSWGFIFPQIHANCYQDPIQVGLGWTAGTHTINFTIGVYLTGHITRTSTDPIQDVTVTATNCGVTSQTNSSGDYVLLLDYGWSGSIIPAKIGWAFAPTERTYSDLTITTDDQDFIGTPLSSVVIYGFCVTSDGDPLYVPEIYASTGESSYTTTDGSYFLTVYYLGSSGWSGTVHPKRDGWGFDPPYRSYANLTDHIGNQDYEGYLYMPDLIVLDVTLSATTGAPGDNPDIDFAIKNQGDGPTSAAFESRIYWSTDTDIGDGADTQLHSFIEMQSIGPNSDKSYSKQIAIPSGVTDGTYYIGIYADKGESISEIDENNNTAWTEFTVNTTDVDLAGLYEIPSAFRLYPNYPNPFNPETSISYGLPEASEVTITIFDSNGRKITDLFVGKKESGIHTLRWNAIDVPSGVYFIRMHAGRFTQMRKCILMK